MTRALDVMERAMAETVSRETLDIPQSNSAA